MSSLKGKTVVFAGPLNLISTDAMLEAEQLGATVAKRVGSRTNIVVCASGTEVWSEQDFLDALSRQRTASVPPQNTRNKRRPKNKSKLLCVKKRKTTKATLATPGNSAAVRKREHDGEPEPEPEQPMSVPTPKTISVRQHKRSYDCPQCCVSVRTDLRERHERSRLHQARAELLDQHEHRHVLCLHLMEALVPVRLGAVAVGIVSDYIQGAEKLAVQAHRQAVSACESQLALLCDLLQDEMLKAAAAGKFTTVVGVRHLHLCSYGEGKNKCRFKDTPNANSFKFPRDSLCQFFKETDNALPRLKDVFQKSNGRGVQMTYSDEVCVNGCVRIELGWEPSEEVMRSSNDSVMQDLVSRPAVLLSVLSHTPLVNASDDALPRRVAAYAIPQLSTPMLESAFKARWPHNISEIIDYILVECAKAAAEGMSQLTVVFSRDCWFSYRFASMPVYQADGRGKPAEAVHRRAIVQTALGQNAQSIILKVLRTAHHLQARISTAGDVALPQGSVGFVVSWGDESQQCAEDVVRPSSSSVERGSLVAAQLYKHLPSSLAVLSQAYFVLDSKHLTEVYLEKLGNNLEYFGDLIMSECLRVGRQGMNAYIVKFVTSSSVADSIKDRCTVVYPHTLGMTLLRVSFAFQKYYDIKQWLEKRDIHCVCEISELGREVDGKWVTTSSMIEFSCRWR